MCIRDRIDDGHRIPPVGGFGAFFPVSDYARRGKKVPAPSGGKKRARRPGRCQPAGKKMGGG